MWSRPVRSHQYFDVVPSLAFQTLPDSETQPKLSTELPSKMLATSQPSSGKSAVGWWVGLTLGDTEGDFVGET